MMVNKVMVEINKVKTKRLPCRKKKPNFTICCTEKDYILLACISNRHLHKIYHNVLVQNPTKDLPFFF